MSDNTDEVSCPKCGGRMWDNRLSKRNPKAPDYKCRSRACDGVIWPPRDAAPATAQPDQNDQNDDALYGDEGTEGYSEAEQEFLGIAAEPTPAPTALTGGAPKCPKCGGPMWDDRTTKKNPKAPDYKCKNKPKFAGGPGCEGVIWPPRENAA